MSGSSSSKSSPPIIPGWLKPLMGQETAMYEGALASIPGLGWMYQNFPKVTPNELADIGSLQGIAQSPSGLSPVEQQAANAYSGFLGSAGQPSSATQAELKLFQNELGPALQQQAELMGQGNSGAALGAQAQGMEEAMVPFMQADLQNQLAAAQGLTGLGGQGEQNILSALQAAGIPRENRLDKLRFGAGVLSQPFSLLGQSIGGGTQVNTQPKF